MAPKYRLCPKCKYRYERIKQKCPNCSAARPKKRVPKHKETLRDHDYEYYKEVSRVLHDITDESCNVCRKPRSKERKLDRDHDHVTGNPRGLVCPQCNMLMRYTQLDAQRAQLIANYLFRAREYPEKFPEKFPKDTKPEGQVANEERQEG